MAVAEIRLGNGVKYTGYNTENNGKITIEEKGDYIYINKQRNEWTKILVTITVLSKSNIEDKKRYFLHDISYRDYKNIENGTTLYRITEFCGKEIAEKVFYSKEEAIKAVVNYLNKEE